MFNQSAHGNALAAGTVLIALIETLVSKGVLDHGDVPAILTRATVASQDALRVIAALQKKFP
jgi:hypothetical protein